MMPWRLLPVLALPGAFSLRRFDDAWQEASTLGKGTWDEAEEDLPDFGELSAAEEVQWKERGKVPKTRRFLRDTPFKNILLVVHCRLTDHHLSSLAGEYVNATAVCERRKPLFQNLKEFFPEMIWWNAETDCDTAGASPHTCLVSHLNRAADRDGIFYMHFDALVRPEVLKMSFDPTAIGVFNEQTQCSVQDKKGCGWPFYGKIKNWVQHAIHSSPNKYKFQAGMFWRGVDDLFYMPRSIFKSYKELVPYWNGVMHEVAGPTMWRMLSRYTGVPVHALGCTGGCCQEVPGQDALNPGFRCGHPFRLSEESTRVPFADAMLMGPEDSPDPVGW